MKQKIILLIVLASYMLFNLATSSLRLPNSGECSKVVHYLYNDTTRRPSNIDYRTDTILLAYSNPEAVNAPAIADKMCSLYKKCKINHITIIFTDTARSNFSKHSNKKSFFTTQCP